MTKLVRGVGINDAGYKASLYKKVDGKLKRVWVCPFYRKWQSMLDRCYSEKYHEKYPTYKDCSVCEEWLTFSNFRAWMEQQDWEGKHLDKDLLQAGNKEYSPDNCVFVTQEINKFLTDRSDGRWEYPVGVYFEKNKNKFRVQCRNPFTCEIEYLGMYRCPEQAHLVWKERKHELACQLAESEHVGDARIAQALRTRFL